MKINYLINPFLIIAFAVALRLLPHPPNVAPIAAMALFGGVYLSKKYALLIPLLALLISDLFIGFYELPLMLFIYGSFLITGCIGIWLKDHKNPGSVIGAALFSSILFYFITNFGVWSTGTIYPKTIQGLLNCYTLAIPFFTNTIIGDLIYTGIFILSYEAILMFGKNMLNAKIQN